jgi:hypothetical protein
MGMGGGWGPGGIVWGPGGPPTGPGLSLSVQDAILYRALRLAQITRGPGRTANPEQFNDALIALNGMLDSLNIQRDAIYTIDNARYTLTPPKTSYSIGQDPTGMTVADFNAPRPINIDQARLVLTSSPTPVYLPLRIATPEEWATITVRQMPTTIPQVLYYDADFPLANLYFWGYPTQANDVELWTWSPLPQYFAITDSVIVPPGYADMLCYNLAVRLADQFGTVAPPNVMTEARRTLGHVKALNGMTTPMGSADWGARSMSTPDRGDWNYLYGGPA